MPVHAYPQPFRPPTNGDESKLRSGCCAVWIRKRGCQPAILTRVEVYAATYLGASDRRRTSVRRRVASRLAWTGLIR
jgi:hypothetical protein